MTATSKWTAPFWTDAAERALTTLLYGAVTMLTADASGAISGNPRQWWLIVGLPTVLSLLKSLLANLKGDEPSASVVDVTSSGERAPGGPADSEDRPPIH